ncbi:hypothetical protein NDU88_004789 [Pleurodeles waltl]|uniref:Uncharacterized protein n=1 Tax=Pleurodeles waltl TaxID=8319 RepID=A0AAV7M7B2_PLEWA|nr:hypothetical protein NDU88_004789 [Pleurodeles waltl]
MDLVCSVTGPQCFEEGPSGLLKEAVSPSVYSSYCGVGLLSARGGRFAASLNSYSPGPADSETSGRLKGVHALSSCLHLASTSQAGIVRGQSGQGKSEAPEALCDVISLGAGQAARTPLGTSTAAGELSSCLRCCGLQGQLKRAAAPLDRVRLVGEAGAREMRVVSFKPPADAPTSAVFRDKQSACRPRGD